MAAPVHAVNVAKPVNRRPHRGQGFFTRSLPFWLLLPALLVLGAIQFYPGLYSLFLSTQEYNAGVPSFVGLKNFDRVFSSSTFTDSVVLTFMFLAGFGTLTLVAAFVIALVLNHKLKLGATYLTIIFIPWVLSDVVVGLIFRLFVVPDYGILTPILSNPALFGAPAGVSILTTPPAPPLIPGIPFPPSPALIYLIMASAWKATPFITLLILSAMQTVSREVLESASIDGADGFNSFRYITLPLVLPTLVVAVFNLTLTGINGVGMVFSLTSGGPGTSTEVLSFLLYTLGFGRLEFGRAAALSVFMAVINLALILLALRLSGQASERS
jgi:multiple sugar transport system permease protein